MSSVSAVPRSTGLLRHLGLIGLALSLVGAVAGALVPASVMGWLRVEVPGFALAWDWLDASLPWLNPLHVIAYAWLALLWKLLAPRGSWWRMPVVLLVVGIGCEVLQQFVPTRQPRVTDVLSDALGIAIGWGVVMAVQRMRRRG
ncbi:MAG TPA: VanZ family protein [Rhodanobacteraceae bacterium]|nr:VanZ family protein [Rhodanobacteraceae bacterium]